MVIMKKLLLLLIIINFLLCTLFRLSANPDKWPPCKHCNKHWSIWWALFGGCKILRLFVSLHLSPRADTFLTSTCQLCHKYTICET